MRWLLWWRPPALLKVVIVNMHQDQSLAIRGVLWGARGAWLQLREASLIRGRGEPEPVDGEVLIPRDNVAFIQVVP